MTQMRDIMFERWSNFRVSVESYPGVIRELSGSYPSTCSVIGLDHTLQLNSTKKIQTKNHGDLFTDVFRQVVFLQVVCVFLFFIFFYFEFYDGLFRYFFLL